MNELLPKYKKYIEILFIYLCNKIEERKKSLGEKILGKIVWKKSSKTNEIYNLENFIML